MKRNISRRRAVTALCGVLFTAVLTGCSFFLPPLPPGEVAVSDIVGSWHSDNGDGKRTELELRPDGTLTWSAVPGGLFDDFPETAKLRWENRTDYVGTWSVEDSATWAQPVVEVSCRIPDGEWGFELVIDGRGPERRLVYWIGDPDMADRLKFQR